MSFVALPLIVKEQVIGVLGLGSDTRRNFDKRSRYLETLATQAALSLQNAMLFEQVQAHAKELEERVAVRTAELEKKARDLERFNKLFVDRDLRMIELKKEIRKLREDARGQVDEFKQAQCMGTFSTFKFSS